MVMTATLYGLQRRGQWLSNPPQLARFGIEPIYAAPSVEQALEQAQLLRFIHGLSTEPRRIPQ
jgi:hypothetical protein